MLGEATLIRSRWIKKEEMFSCLSFAVYKMDHIWTPKILLRFADTCLSSYLKTKSLLTKKIP